MLQLSFALLLLITADTTSTRLISTLTYAPTHTISINAVPNITSALFVYLKKLNGQVTSIALSHL